MHKNCKKSTHLPRVGRYLRALKYIIRAKLSFFYEFSKLKAVNPIFLLFFNKSVGIRAIEGFFLQASPPPSLWVAAREIFQKSNKKIIQHLYMCTLIIWGLFTIWHQTIFHQELENLRIFHKPNELTRIRRSDENGREETGNCLQFLLKFLFIPTHATKKFLNYLPFGRWVYDKSLKFLTIITL